MRFDRVAPILAVSDVTAAIERYRKLGFDGRAYGEDATPIYGFLSRGKVELHLTRVGSRRPGQEGTACYIYVDDADALYEEWRAANVDGKLHPPFDTPYELRELAYLDPDGNLLRVGSPIA
jgi:hypothetical protein